MLTFFCIGIDIIRGSVWFGNITFYRIQKFYFNIYRVLVCVLCGYTYKTMCNKKLFELPKVKYIIIILYPDKQKTMFKKKNMKYTGDEVMMVKWESVQRQIVTSFIFCLFYKTIWLAVVTYTLHILFPKLSGRLMIFFATVPISYAM